MGFKVTRPLLLSYYLCDHSDIQARGGNTAYNIEYLAPLIPQNGHKWLLSTFSLSLCLSLAASSSTQFLRWILTPFTERLCH